MFRILFVFVFWSCGRPERGDDKEKGWGDKKKDSPTALLVDVSSVSKGSVSDHHEFTGVLESKSEASIIPDVSGVVKAVHVREGDVVKKGDALADLVNPAIDAALQRAKIELERAKREFGKTKQLQRQGAVSKRDFLEAKSALETAETSFVEAEKSQKKLVVQSPLSGVVSTVSIRPGEQAGASEAFRVVDPEQLRLVASIPERSMGSLKSGFEVAITPAAYDSERSSSGRIERLGPVVDSRTGSIKVFIDVNSRENQMLPGQFVRAKVQTDVHDDVLVIPKSALVYRDGQPSVFVLGPAPEIEESSEETDVAPATNTAVARDLSIGYSDEKWVEVVSGLVEGEDVITLGNTALRAGSPVRIESGSEVPGDDTP